MLFTTSPTHAPNWRLFGLGLMTTVFLWGLLRNEPKLCLAGVILMTLGLAQTAVFERWLQQLGMSHLGLTSGIVGLGILLITLRFGDRIPKAMVVTATLLVGLSVMDFLPKTLAWRDGLVAPLLGIMYVALWLRLHDPLLPTLFALPEAPRIYLVATTAPSWSFVVLSFALLVLGTIVSLCHRQRPKECRH